MMNIPFSPPDITDLEIKYVTEVLKSGWITTGPKTKEFEKKIAEYCGTRKAVCLNSATAAMEMTLRVLGVGEGDEVITSAYTYTASASVICHVGATPVLIDTAKDSYEMDYRKLEKAITEKTKVIIPVDIAGVMCDYDRIFEIVESKRNLFNASNEIQEKIGRITVLADAAHSFGATYKNKKSGSVADFTSFSFHAVKNLTTAEGGAITWNAIENLSSEDIYRQYMILSLHGQTKDALSKNKLGAWEYDILTPAYKCNMTDIMAAIGLAQLERYEEMLHYRHHLISLYDNLFSNFKNIHVLVHREENQISSGHLYMIRLLNKDESFRNEFIIKMAQKGISSNVHYKPLPLLTAYKHLGFCIEDYPNAYDMYKNEVTLPLNSLMTEEQINYVTEVLSELLRGIE